ncbi:hypothetical protein AB0Q95_36280 [Streptomyces sp. NPDC059900]|uniref:hypothetical protein n=1 Tax=Streptomyces sp. NPDC059900 TaxID=3155816 RepID=UPI00343BE5A5
MPGRPADPWGRERPAVCPAPDASGAAAGVAARCTSRNGATGIGRAAGGGDDGVQGAAPAALSRPVTGRAVALSAPDDAEEEEEAAAECRLLDLAASRIPVRADVAAKEGFCHVGSRMPNAESATPDPPSRTARWIGGSPDHAPGIAPASAGAPPGAEPPADGGAPGEPPPPAPASSAPAGAPAPAPAPRPRNRSKNPTPQPSAPASVTKDAIWSA